VRADDALLVAGHDERVLEHPADDVVAGVRDLGLVGHEDPRATEDALPFELEELPVVVQVGRDHPATDVGQHLGLIGHRCFIPSGVQPAPWCVLLSRFSLC
jgi:hypothetical protein